MKHYKDTHDNLFGFEDSDTIPDGLTEITIEEAREIAASKNLPPELTQHQKDELRYQRRAADKDSLIAWMAADNIARVRAGTWTVADLQALLVDLAPVNSMMQTLSFELAAQSIASSSNVLLTDEIKTAWVQKLTEHFYTEAQ